jgi:hypothetical protein
LVVARLVVEVLAVAVVLVDLKPQQVFQPFRQELLIQLP